jgi:hypothetical protein
VPTRDDHSTPMRNGVVSALAVSQRYVTADTKHRFSPTPYCVLPLVLDG